jgi:excisionase family DNA binding protein
METMTPEPYVGATEVAKLLGVRPAFVRTAVEAHGMPVARIGRYLRFRLSQVEAWAKTSQGVPANTGGGRPPETRKATKGRRGR